MKGKLIFMLSIVALAAGAHAQFTFDLSDAQGGSRGAARWNGNSVRYAGSISNSTGGSVYINSVEFSATSGDWTNINVDASDNFATILGTEILDGGFYGAGFLDGIMKVSLTDEANTSYGMRSGVFTLRGGSSTSANDVLGSESFDFDLYDGYGGITAEITNPVQDILPGQTTNPFHWVIHNGSLPIWSWAAVTFGSSNTNVNLASFGSWPTSANFNYMLAPSEVWSGDSVTYTADVNAPIGSMTNYLRAFGGRYIGDQDFMTSTAHTVNVVPEPMSMSALALGLGAVIARRRRKA